MANRSGDSDADLLQRYLQEIEAHPRLDPAKELELARAIAAAGPRADRARRQLLRSNLRLVVEIARRYEGRGALLLDLVQEGNLGLMRAVERFDPATSASFTESASWYIRQAIATMLGDPGRATTPHDPGLAPVAAPGAQPVRAARRPLTSLIGGAMSGTNAPYEAAADALEREALELQLEWLSQREQMVLRLRFGLDETGELTADKVTEELEITKEHLRQIERKALSKLRHPSVARLWSPAQRRATGT